MHSLMTKTGGKSRPSGWYRKEALRIDVGREVGRDRGGEETGGERTVSKGSLRRKASRARTLDLGLRGSSFI